MKKQSALDEIIEYYKNSKINWEKELWDLTEEYFHKHVLPLLVFHRLTKEDESYILFHGFENILRIYKAEREPKHINNNSILAPIAFGEQIKDISTAPLDKTNLQHNLFGAFLGFTFIAAKDKQFLDDIYYKSKDISNLNAVIKNYEIESKKYSKKLAKRGLTFVHPLSKHNRKKYRDIWVKYEQMKKKKKNPRASIRQVVFNLGGYQNDIEANRYYKAFHKFCFTDHNINSLAEYDNFLSTYRQ